ncbi:MAG: YlxR family protein [Acidimicrobiia bacterium]|nr:YlxR family protein [Acidimicrobiia bacterium]
MGCRTRRPLDEGGLVRIVRAADGSLRIGRSLPGRGAWLCGADHQPAPACLGLAERRGTLQRALRGSISGDAVAALRSRLTGHRPGARD